MTRILSGIRPTGKLHLGNLLGAVQSFVELQNQPDKECYFFAADLHALTTITGPIDLRNNSVRVIREYLACGLNPNQSVLYRQSDVPEIPYFATLLSMVAGYGRLQNCTTFKDKSEKQQAAGAGITAGLFNYPVLMAADILIVRANYVPVGEDQLQHLEMAREFARRFNRMFDTDLIDPEPWKGSREPLRVPGLDGSGKMGKSDGNTIDLVEDPDSIRKKVMNAKTDLGPVKGEEMSQEMKNLYLLMELCSSPDIYADFKSRYDDGEQRFYGEMKAQLAEDIIALLAPIRDRYESSPECSEAAAEEILADGASKARAIAKEVLEDARTKMGI